MLRASRCDFGEVDRRRMRQDKDLLSDFDSRRYRRLSYGNRLVTFLPESRSTISSSGRADARR